MRKFTILLYLLLPLTLIGQDGYMPLEYEIPAFFHPGDLKGVESLTIRTAWLRRGKAEHRVFTAEYQFDSLGRTVSEYLEIAYSKSEKESHQATWNYDVNGFLWTGSLDGYPDVITARRTFGEGYYEDTMFHQNGHVSIYRFSEDRRKTEVRYHFQVDMLDDPENAESFIYDDQGIIEMDTQGDAYRTYQKENGKLILRGREWETWESHIEFNDRGLVKEYVDFDLNRCRPKATSRTTYTYTWR